MKYLNSFRKIQYLNSIEIFLQFCVFKYFSNTYSLRHLPNSAKTFLLAYRLLG